MPENSFVLRNGHVYHFRFVRADDCHPDLPRNLQDELISARNEDKPDEVLFVDIVIVASSRNELPSPANANFAIPWGREAMKISHAVVPVEARCFIWLEVKWVGPDNQVVPPAIGEGFVPVDIVDATTNETILQGSAPIQMPVVALPPTPGPGTPPAPKLPAAPKKRSVAVPVAIGLAIVGGVLLIAGGTAS